MVSRLLWLSRRWRRESSTQWANSSYCLVGFLFWYIGPPPHTGPPLQWWWLGNEPVVLIPVSCPNHIATMWHDYPLKRAQYTIATIPPRTSSMRKAIMIFFFFFFSRSEAGPRPYRGDSVTLRHLNCLYLSRCYFTSLYVDPQCTKLRNGGLFSRVAMHFYDSMADMTSSSCSEPNWQYDQETPNLVKEPVSFRILESAQLLDYTILAHQR